MVERSLSMREVPGSLPGSSSLFLHTLFLLALAMVIGSSSDRFP